MSQQRFFQSPVITGKYIYIYDSMVIIILLYVCDIQPSDARVNWRFEMVNGQWSMDTCTKSSFGHDPSPCAAPAPAFADTKKFHFSSELKWFLARSPGS